MILVINITLEVLDMELLIDPPGPKPHSRSSSQKEKASLLPALLLEQVLQSLRHLTTAVVALLFPLVHVETPRNDIFPTNPPAEDEKEAGFGLNCCCAHTSSPGASPPPCAHLLRRSACL